MGFGGWGGVIAAAAAGHAKGKFNRQQLDREEMLQALSIEAQKRQEARSNRQIDLEDRRLTGAEADRKELRQMRVDQFAAQQEKADADRAERAREADQRAATVRQNRANTSSKPPTALNQDLRRQQFVDHRRTELMKPVKGRFGTPSPGMAAGAAQQQAEREAAEIFGAGAAGTPTVRGGGAARDPGGDVTLPAGPKPAGQTAETLRAAAERAIANGADPARVNARLEQKLRELETNTPTKVPHPGSYE